MAKPESERNTLYKQACIDKSAKLRARQASSALNQDNGSLPDEATKLQAYRAEAAIPDSRIRQPSLTEHEAHYKMSEPELMPNTRLPKSELPTQKLIKVEIIFPRLSEEGHIEVPLDLHCLGMTLMTSSGVQVQRCTFLTLAADIEDSAESLYEEQLESSIAFLDNKQEISQGYEEIAAAEELDNYMAQATRCHTRIFNRNQMSSVFHLKDSFPKLFRDKGVLITYFEPSNQSTTYQLMLLASPSEQSKLTSKVIHIAAYQNHSYAVKWGIDLSTVERTLHFLSKANRFSDVAVNLCVRIEDTLAGRKPVELDFLAGAGLYIAGLDGIPNSLRKEVGTLRQQQQDRVTSGLAILWTCSEMVAAPSTYLCSSNSTPDGILQEQVIKTASHPAVLAAKQKLEDEISKSGGNHMGISRLTAELADLSTAVSAQQAVRSVCKATSNVLLASKGCYDSLIYEYRTASAQAVHLPWLLNSAHKHFAAPIRDPCATSTIGPWAIHFNNHRAANRAAELLAHWLEHHSQVITVSTRTVEAWMANHLTPVISGAWQQIHRKLTMRVEVDQRLRTLANHFIMTNIDSLASAIDQLQSRRSSHQGMTKTLRQVWDTLEPVKHQNQSQAIGYMFNMSTGLNMFNNTAVSIGDISEIPAQLHARSLIPKPKPSVIRNHFTGPPAQTVITLMVVQSNQVTLMMADIEDTMSSTLQTAWNNGYLSDDSTLPHNCRVFKVTFSQSSTHSTPPHVTKIDRHRTIYTEGIRDFDILLIASNNSRSNESNTNSLNQIWDKQAGQLYAECEQQMTAIMAGEHSRKAQGSPEPAVQESDEWSPIAAKQVDASKHPLEQYKQARARANGIENVEQHCDWAQRMHHRQVTEGNGKIPTLRRSLRKANPADRFVVSTSQPMEDDSSADDYELQWALEQQGPPKLIQQDSQGQPIVHQVNVSGDGKLPSSREIAKTASTRSRQMKITDMRKVTYVRRPAAKQTAPPEAQHDPVAPPTKKELKLINQHNKGPKRRRRKLRKKRLALNSQPTSGAESEHCELSTDQSHSDFQNDLDKSQN